MIQLTMDLDALKTSLLGGARSAAGISDAQGIVPNGIRIARAVVKFQHCLLLLTFSAPHSQVHHPSSLSLFTLHSAMGSLPRGFSERDRKGFVQTGISI